MSIQINDLAAGIHLNQRFGLWQSSNLSMLHLSCIQIKELAPDIHRIHGLCCCHSFINGSAPDFSQHLHSVVHGATQLPLPPILGQYRQGAGTAVFSTCHLFPFRLVKPEINLSNFPWMLETSARRSLSSVRVAVPFCWILYHSQSNQQTSDGDYCGGSRGTDGGDLLIQGLCADRLVIVFLKYFY